MSSPETQTVVCKAHEWTNVCWMVGRIWPVTTGVTVPTGTTVLYRRYGVCVPPYMEGKFTTHDSFTVYPWEAFVSVDLRPTDDSPVTAITTR